MPTPHAQRHLVTPRHTLRLDGGPRWPLPPGQLEFYSSDPILFRPGVTFGLTRDFELGIVQPFRLTPDGDILDPTLHGLYQFVEGTVDVGLHFQVSLPLFNEPHYLGTLVGVPLQFHLGDRVRLDMGGFLTMAFALEDDPATDDDVFVDAVFPLLLPINVTRNVFLGPEFAVATVGEFDDVAVPLGFFAGYTIEAGGGTLGDISGRFRSLDITYGIDPWAIIFAADLYFDL